MTASTTKQVSDSLEVTSKENLPESEYKKLSESLAKYLTEENLQQVRKAFEFAAHHHATQKRMSGEPYIVHPVNVAFILSELKLDVSSIIAAILHDVVEDTTATLEDVEKEFGTSVKDLVDGMTKIGKIRFRSNAERLAENFRKMIIAMTKDLRVIIIKLADRLHNMRTLQALPPEKRDRIAQETLDIYAPLANRLGIHQIKNELEDLCLRQLKNDIYQNVRSRISAKKNERDHLITEIKEVVTGELVKYGFKNFQVYGRPKHFYSIYKKMIDRQLEFEDIYDLFGFRIVVDGIKDCYEALGIIHALWKPMPGRFKDYIAMPKANMYQSLHTTVIRPDGEPVEFQIRTFEMHQFCEFGVAAHWAYKEKKFSGQNAAGIEKFSWLRQMMQWQNEIKDAGEFLEAVKVDLFDEEIYVFTPKGDVLELPVGATALDFAFTVHTNVGLRTVGIKVNGRMVPIKKVLRSGDIIEVLTSPHQKPSKDWLNIVTTSRARNKIRSFLRSEQREASKKIGIELFTQELHERHLDYDKFAKSDQAEQLAKLAKESHFEDVIVAVGYGKLSAKDLLAKLFHDDKDKQLLSMIDGSSQKDHAKKDHHVVTLPAQTHSTDAKKSKSSRGILVSGLEHVMVNFAQCCNPLPGEDVVGFITRGRGVTIHRGSCRRAHDMDPQRRIDVGWDKTEETGFHITFLHVLCKDKPGVLAEVTNIIASCGANINKANIRVQPNGLGQLDFELGIKSLMQLQAVIKKVESIPAVMCVERKNVLTPNKKDGEK